MTRTTPPRPHPLLAALEVAAIGQLEAPPDQIMEAAAVAVARLEEAPGNPETLAALAGLLLVDHPPRDPARESTARIRHNPSRWKHPDDDPPAPEKVAPPAPTQSRCAVVAPHGRFRRSVLETGNASRSYRQAYDADDMAPESVHTEAARLLKRPAVRARVKALQAERRAADADSLASVVQMLQVAFRTGRARGYARSMLQAAIAIARVAGIDKAPVVTASDLLAGVGLRRASFAELAVIMAAVAAARERAARRAAGGEPDGGGATRHLAATALLWQQRRNRRHVGRPTLHVRSCRTFPTPCIVIVRLIRLP